MISGSLFSTKNLSKEQLRVLAEQIAQAPRYHVQNRHNRKYTEEINKDSTIITTNLLFDRWHEIFIDEALTGAIVDRISYKSHVVNMCGESYRVKETINWLKRGENDEIADVFHSSGSIFN